MKRKMRALAMLLALALILSLSGMTASADEDGIVASTGDMEHDAAVAWQNYAEYNNAYSGLNLGSQQFFIADFTNSLKFASSITGIRFSANNEISGYVGYYIKNISMNMVFWIPLLKGYDENQVPSYEKEVVLTGNGSVVITQDSMTLDGIKSGEIYIGFAVDGTIEDNTTVTISTMSNEEEIESHSFEFTANSTTPDPSPTTPPSDPSPTPVLTSITLHRLVTHDYNEAGELVGTPHPETPEENPCTAFTLVAGNAVDVAQPGILRLMTKITPEGANPNVTWKIKDQTLNREFTVDEYVNYYKDNNNELPIVTFGLTEIMASVTGVRSGTVTLTATSVENPEIQTSCVITVTGGIKATTGSNTVTFDTLLDAAAHSDSGVNTTFTVPAGSDINGVKVAKDSAVRIIDVKTSGNVTVKEMTITQNSGTITRTVYVITNGTAKAAIIDALLSKDNTVSGAGEQAASYINVAEALAKAVYAEGDNIDINSITRAELSLSKEAQTVLPDAIKNANDVKDKNLAFQIDVHPVLKITEVKGEQLKVYTYDTSDDLATGARFDVTLTGLYNNKTYTIYHYASNGTLKETYNDKTPSGGKITLQLNSFSYLLGEVTGTASAGNGDVIFTYLQGNFGNTYEFTMQLKVPDDSYTPTLNLGGFRELSPSNAASYAASDVVAYTVNSFANGGSYYYTFKVKMFAKFLNTPIYVTVMHEGNPVAVSRIAQDTANLMQTSDSGYGYSMADYVGILNLTNSSYGNLYTQIRGYADAVLAKFPDA